MKKQAQEEMRRLILTLGVILILLGGSTLYFSWPLLTGTTIVLDTLPIDPFDPFRGQYLTIRYNISSLPPIDNLQEGDTVYVSLIENSEGIWERDEISTTKPRGVFIAGTVHHVYEKHIAVKYGIEQYFFERGAKFSTENITVKAKVDEFGKARIVELLQNNQPLVVEYDKRLTS